MVTRGVVFDLDDTLCLEVDYFRSGFRRVAAELSSAGVGEFGWLATQLLEWGLEPEHRGRVFDHLLDVVPSVGDKYSVGDLVELYRSHRPDIALLPGYRQLLGELRSRRLVLGLITDGPVASQSAKVEALGLTDLLDHIVITDQWGTEFRKPHPRAYIELEEEWQLEPNALVYVGDNPSKDFITPNDRGWLTVRVIQDGQRHGNLEARPSGEPFAVVNGVAGLKGWLWSRLALPQG